MCALFSPDWVDSSALGPFIGAHPLTGTHEGSQSGLSFTSPGVFAQPGEERHEPTHAGCWDMLSIPQSHSSTCP